MTLASLTPIKRSALIVTFVGLHVPLTVLTVYGLLNELTAFLPVLLVTLIATLVGVCGTIYALLRILDLEPATDGTATGVLSKA